MEGSPPQPPSESPRPAPLSGGHPDPPGGPSDAEAAPEPDGQASLAGQRAWLGQLDRRLSTRTYAGAAAAVLALAAAIVAIVLAVDARETSATRDDLDELAEQLTGVSEQAREVGDLQGSIDSIEGRLSSIEGQLEELTTDDDRDARRLDVLEDDIEDLRQELSDLEPGGG